MVCSSDKQFALSLTFGCAPRATTRGVISLYWHLPSAKCLILIDTHSHPYCNGFYQKIAVCVHESGDRFPLRVIRCGAAKANEEQFRKCESFGNKACPSYR